jgi:hypothetical protein
VPAIACDPWILSQIGMVVWNRTQFSVMSGGSPERGVLVSLPSKEFIKQTNN